jgi:hypothetical protein
MTAPNREVFKNNASTTLNGAINDSVTSLTATSGAVFPSTGNFRLICGTEIMICTARSTDTLTVVRGAEGSVAASHADLAVLTHIVTADAIDRVGKDNVALWGVSTFPPLNKLVAADGKTLLTTSDFSWTNQGTASVSDLGGTIAMRVPATANTQHRIFNVSSPSAPWVVIAAFKLFIPGEVTNSNVQFGLNMRESGTGKFYTFGLNRQSSATQRFAIDRWSSVTNFNATQFLANNPIWFGDICWMKMEDDNTNLKFYISNDGVEWVLVLTEARATYFATGPNQIGISGNHGDDSTAKDAVMRLLHWHTE